jgi:hypothetical protein
MWSQVRRFLALILDLFLLSQSMGGLLAADSLKEFINTRPDIHAPLWPNIIACLAFDTPVCASFFDAWLI